MSRKYTRFEISRVRPIRYITHPTDAIEELSSSLEEEDAELAYVCQHDWFIIAAGLRHGAFNAVIGVWSDPFTCRHYAAVLTVPGRKEAHSA